jgi:hypothetical protein
VVAVSLVVLDPKADDAAPAPDRDEVSEAESCVRDMLAPHTDTGATLASSASQIFLARNVRCSQPSREKRLKASFVSNGLEMVASIECVSSDSESDEEADEGAAQPRSGQPSRRKKKFSDLPNSKRRRLTNNHQHPRRMVYATGSEDFLHLRK